MFTLLSFNSIPAGEKHSSLSHTHVRTELSHGLLHISQVKRPASGRQNAEEIVEIETSSPKNKDYVATPDAELDGKLEINLKIISNVSMNLYVEYEYMKMVSCFLPLTSTNYFQQGSLSHLCRLRHQKNGI